MAGPKSLIRSAMRRFVCLVYGEHPLDRIRWELRRMEMRQRQHATKARLDTKVAEVLSATAAGFKVRESSVAKVRTQLKQQVQRINQLDEVQEVQQILRDQVAGLRKDAELDAVNASEIQSKLTELDLFLGDADARSVPLADRLEMILGELDMLVVGIEAGALARKDLSAASLCQQAELDAVKELANMIRESVGKSDVECAALSLQVEGLQQLVAVAGDATLERLGSLDLRTGKIVQQVESVKAVVETVNASEIQSKLTELDEVQEVQQILRDQVAGLRKDADEIMATHDEHDMPDGDGQGELASSLKDAIEEVNIAVGRDRRLLHELRTWSEAISSLDLEVRLAQWERAQASLEQLEAKLEEVAEGGDESHEAIRKIAEQVRRVRGRVESLESNPNQSPDMESVSELRDAIEDIEAIHSRSSEHIRKVESLGRRTRDLIRRHLENHHAAGFVSDPWLKEARNKHQGERCFLLGSGPSLAAFDPERLKGEVVMSLNGAAQLDGLKSDYFLTVAHVWWTQHVAWLENQDVGIRRFLPPYVDCRDGGIPTSRIRVASVDEAQIRGAQPPMSFSTDAAGLVFLGGSVVFPALQILFHLGFEEVVMLGIDHSYGDAVQGAVPVSNLKHFKPDYYPGPACVHCDIPAMEHAYSMALEAWNADGRRLVNATPGTQLDIIPQVDLGTVLGEESAQRSPASGRSKKKATTTGPKKPSRRKKSSSRSKTTTARKRTRT